MNGLSLRSDAKATLNFGGKERKDRYADYGLIGYSETPKGAEIKANLVHTVQSDLQSINDATDVTLIFETDTGKRYTIRNAFSATPPELSGDGGEISVHFIGQPAIES